MKEERYFLQAYIVYEYFIQPRLSSPHRGWDNSKVKFSGHFVTFLFRVIYSGDPKGISE